MVEKENACNMLKEFTVYDVSLNNRTIPPSLCCLDTVFGVTPRLKLGAMSRETKHI